jgi:hypothetical protein
MSDTGRNSTIRLSIVRSFIDKQQQIIAMLENKLQQSILGGTTTTTDDSFANDLTLLGVLDEVATIYGDQRNGDNSYSGYTGAMQKGVQEYQNLGFDPEDIVEQDALRQMLYQARALLGELRVEEQHWNGEVGQEKERRKELGEFTKA